MERCVAQDRYANWLRCLPNLQDDSITSNSGESGQEAVEPECSCDRRYQEEGGDVCGRGEWEA